MGGSGGPKVGRVRAHTVCEGSHLVPFEQVDQVAEAASGFLTEELKRWWRQEEAWTLWWKTKSRRDRTMITEEWKSKVGGDPKLAEREKGKL